MVMRVGWSVMGWGGGEGDVVGGDVVGGDVMG